jgi:hypothetical protein
MKLNLQKGDAVQVAIKSTESMIRKRLAISGSRLPKQFQPKLNLT